MTNDTRRARVWWWLVIGAAGLAALLLWWNGRGTAVPVYVLEARPLTQDVVASGRLSVPARARLAVEIPGVVIARLVQEGDTVQAGQPLLRLDPAEWQARLDEADAALYQLRTVRRPQALAELRDADSAATQAAREAERRRALARERAIAREATEQAEQAETRARLRRDQAKLAQQDLAADGPEERLLQARRANALTALARTELRAPFAGQVITRQVEAGDTVQPGSTLFELVPDSISPEAVVPVDETFLGLLQVGQSATLLADAFPDTPVPATITRIAPRIDPQRGTVDVHLAPETLPAGAREDMTLSATLHTARRDAALVLPHDALKHIRGDRAVVQVVRDGRVEDVPVQLGLRGLQAREVVGGLQAGEQVLAQPRTPGLRVRPLIQPLPDDR